jgi:DNA-binding MarR family transcriptional regulator
MKKSLLIAAVTAVSLVSFAGVGLVSADTVTNTGARDSGLVKAIADTFKLNQSDVQKVIDDQRTKNYAERMATANERVRTELSQLVKDGKLTQAQADAVTTKRTELQSQRSANRTTMQNKTETERHAQMQKDRDALDAWLKGQGIATEYRYLLMGGHGGHKGYEGRDGHGMGRGNMNANSASTTSTSDTSS